MKPASAGFVFVARGFNLSGIWYLLLGVVVLCRHCPERLNWTKLPQVKNHGPVRSTFKLPHNPQNRPNRRLPRRQSIRPLQVARRPRLRGNPSLGGSPKSSYLWLSPRNSGAGKNQTAPDSTLGLREIRHTFQRRISLFLLQE